MGVFIVKLIDTNGVVSFDRLFFNKSDAELYVKEREKISPGWELQIFERQLVLNRRLGGELL